MTFAREIMAFACLGVVWVNTTLIVLHAVRDLSTLRALAKKLRPLQQPGPEAFGVVHGTFQAEGETEGPVYRVVQTARRGRDGKIYFHDRRYESTFGSGSLTTSTECLRLTPSSIVRVWPSAQAVAKYKQPVDAAEFEQLFERAVHAAGVERNVDVRVEPGALVYVAGTLSADGSALGGTPEQPLLVSAENPVQWLHSAVGRSVAVLVAMVTVGAGLSALSFWPPAFGALSQLGAFGLFLYFLLIQPVGVWLSKKNRMPHEAELGGIWTRPSSIQAASFAPRQAEP